MLEKIKHNKTLILYLSTILLYLWVRTEVAILIVEPKQYPDSALYLEMSTRQINSSDFWAGELPVVVPITYGLLGRNPTTISVFQTIFSACAWIFLAATIAYQLKKPVIALFAFCTILIFSLSAEIMLWDWVLLSESISGSLYVIFLASWMWFLNLNSWSWKFASLVILIGLLWMFTRDSNGPVTVGISFLLGLLALIGYLNKRFLFLIGVFALFFTLSTWSINTSGRWIGPNLNLLSTRILSNAEYLSFFQENGMPVNSALLDLAGERARRADLGFNKDPDLKEFHAWHRENGKSVYFKFLLSDPARSLLAPLENFSTLIYTEPMYYYAPKGFSTILPNPFDKIFFFKSWNPLTLWGTVLTISLGLSLALRRLHRKWVMPIVMCLLIYPIAFLTWNASAGGDSSRHVYQFLLHYHLSLWTMLFVSMDTLVVEIIPRYSSSLHRLRYMILGMGAILVIVSVFTDFIFSTGDEFSIGYAQALGILVGLSCVGIGLRWIRSEKREEEM